MIDINVTLLIQMVNFFVFLILMNMVLYRPIRRLVAQRNQLISDQEAGIARADAEAVAAVEEFEQSLQEARNVGREKVNELKEAGFQQEKDLIQRASDEAARQVQEMRGKIKQDIGQARDQLSSQIQAFAVELAQKILGRSI